ncbi:MAG: 3-hydroxybutyryl-CoA dehydrogenase, partial [Chloroflexi bacterium]|nr:3-hydroxybutyryl-CoA dehydrogenase [Chloroflexota bacterium]
EIADYGGLDVWEKVTGHLFPQLGASQEAPELIREKVAKGELGVKTGAGFYTYGDPAQQERQSGERDRKLLGLLQVKAGNNKA